MPAAGPRATERWTLRLALALSLGGAGVATYLVTFHAAIAGEPKRGVCTFTDTISCKLGGDAQLQEAPADPVVPQGVLRS